MPPKAPLLGAVLALLLVGCGGVTESSDDDLPYGYRSRLTYCRALSECSPDGPSAETCAGPVEDAPTMTVENFTRCVELVDALDCSAPKDTGVWISTRFACGL